MKTTTEIIRFLEKEHLYCMEMHKESIGQDAMDSLQYLIQAVTIQALLDEIKSPPVIY